MIVNNEADIEKFKDYTGPAAPAPAKPAAAPTPTPAPAAQVAPPISIPTAAPVAPAAPSSGGVAAASPRARALAREKGIDLHVSTVRPRKKNCLFPVTVRKKIG